MVNGRERPKVMWARTATGELTTDQERTATAGAACHAAEAGELLLANLRSDKLNELSTTRASKRPASERPASKRPTSQAISKDRAPQKGATHNGVPGSKLNLERATPI